MSPGAEPGEFAAGNYHDLVDMPFFIGRFDLDSARVEDRWFRLATYPEGALAGEARATTWEHIHAMMPPMSAVFDDTPFDTYTIMAVFGEEYLGASALEHGNSYLGVLRARDSPDRRRSHRSPRTRSSMPGTSSDCDQRSYGRTNTIVSSRPRCSG